jgi:hypothetical protein
VLPAWFDPGAPPPYDHLGVVDAPFTLDDEGYAIVATEGDVHQVFGSGVPVPAWRAASARHPAARTARRLARAGVDGRIRASAV